MTDARPRKSVDQFPDRLTFGNDLANRSGSVGAETQFGDVEQRVEDLADEVAHVDRVVYSGQTRDPSSPSSGAGRCGRNLTIAGGAWQLVQPSSVMSTVPDSAEFNPCAPVVAITAP